MFNVAGRVALITGGCRGIGKSITYALLNRGARVGLLDIHDEEGSILQKSLSEEFGHDRCVFVPCDVTKPKQLEEAFEQTQDKLGELSIVCNNAGVPETKDWRKVLDVNLSAVIHGTKLGIAYFLNSRPTTKELPQSQDRGVIINVASVAGIQPLQLTPVYTASKMGVVGFTRCFEPLAKKLNIRVTALCPNFTQTRLVEDFILSNPKTENAIRAELEKTGKSFELLSPETVAEAAMKLIADQDNGGKALAVSPISGIHYVDFGEYVL